MLNQGSDSKNGDQVNWVCNRFDNQGSDGSTIKVRGKDWLTKPSFCVIFNHRPLYIQSLKTA
jgi:hypothetical protein